MSRVFTAGPGSNSLPCKRLLYSAGGPTRTSGDDSALSVAAAMKRDAFERGPCKRIA